MSKSKNKQPLISVCIPAYEMHGKGHLFLEHSLKVLCRQNFKNFEVVISDNSVTDLILKVCARFDSKLNIRYCRNPDRRKGVATNINNAIVNSKGKIVKMLFLDDFLKDTKVLYSIARAFDLKKDRWLVTGYTHTKNGSSFFNTLYPAYNDKLYLGENTIGSPSVLAIRNDNPLLFDPKLKWLLDCDYYKRYYDKFGKPKILYKVLSVIRVGDHQITNNEATERLRFKEYQYVLKKYQRGIKYWQMKFESVIKYFKDKFKPNE